MSTAVLQSLGLVVKLTTFGRTIEIANRRFRNIILTIVAFLALGICLALISCHSSLVIQS